MPTLQLKIADFLVCIHAKYPYVATKCQDYVTCFDEGQADFVLSVSEAEIEATLAQNHAEGGQATLGMAESVCLYRQWCMQLPSREAVMLHGAVITDGTYTYAFTAPSGTGKSTHIKLWQQVYGGEIQVINGDKPILRRTHEGWMAYGTPWCGKEGYQTNRGMPLTALCFLHRGAENVVTPMTPQEAVVPIFHQVMLPTDKSLATATLGLLDDLLTKVPLYHMTCNMTTDAPRVAREAMMPKG